MTLRLLAVPGILLPILCAAGCSSAGEEYDPNSSASIHGERKAEAMINQAERTMRQGDLAGTERHLAAMADSLARHPKAQLLFARTLIAEGRWQECESLLNLIGEDNADLAELHLIWGTLEEARGRWEAARVAYAKAAEMNPEAISPLLFMASTFHAVGDPKGAAAMLEREHAKRPGRFELQFALGEAYLAANDPKMASIWFREALDHDQGSRKVRAQLAFAQSLSGQHLKALQSVQSVGDKSLPPHVKLAIGRSALMVDETHLAVRWLEQYLSHYADDSGAWLDLARAYFLLDNPFQTMESLKACLRLDPSRSEALVLLGHLRVRAGQYSLAINSYLEAIRLGAEAAELAPLMEDLLNTQTSQEVIAAGAAPSSVSEEE